MTEHKFTDEEVIKALEWCIQSDSCEYCEYREKTNKDDVCPVRSDALDLIKRQKEEIERLQEKQVEDEQLLNLRVIESVNAVSEAHRKYEMALEEHLKSERAEAIKEFAERLKQTAYTQGSITGYQYQVVDFAEIDNLVKEMTEGKQ